MTTTDYNTPRNREAVLNLIQPIMHAKAAEGWDLEGGTYEVRDLGSTLSLRPIPGATDPEEFLRLALAVGARLPREHAGIAVIVEAITPDEVVFSGGDLLESRIAMVVLRGNVNASMVHVRGEAVPTTMEFGDAGGHLPYLMSALIGNDLTRFKDSATHESCADASKGS